MPSSTSSPSQRPDEGERPAGADRGEDAATEQRRVEDGVDASGSGREHRLDEIVASRQDDIGAEASHELRVGRARVGEHPEPAQLRDRNHVGREEPGAAGDGERRARARGRAAPARGAP